MNKLEDTKVYRLARISADDVKELLDELSTTTVRMNSNRQNSGVGRTQAFGNIMRQGLGFGQARNNRLHAKLYALLRELGNKIVPFRYDGIQLNHNYESKPHVDKNNYGHSVIVSFGDYGGGSLIVGRKKYSTRLHPLMFNGSLLEHHNEKITGNKYSVVFFRTKHKKTK